MRRGCDATELIRAEKVWTLDPGKFQLALLREDRNKRSVYIVQGDITDLNVCSKLSMSIENSRLFNTIDFYENLCRTFL